MAAGTKDRIMETTAQLFQRYGYTGTGLKQIVAEANAPFGSIYHHFPNGKAQLGEEVIRRSGQMYKELFEAIFDAAPDVVTRDRRLLPRRRGDAAPDRLRRRVPDRDRRARGREHERAAAQGDRRRVRELDRCGHRAPRARPASPSQRRAG